MKSINGDFWRLDDYANEIVRIKEQNQSTLRFSNVKAILRAAKDVAKFYDEWEQKKLVCLDDPKVSFYFDSMTGVSDYRGKKILVGNECPIGEEWKLSESTAPEIVLGTTDTNNIYSQRWTIAVVLFELLYHCGSPFRGYNSMLQVFYAPEEEYLWMAENGVFNMENGFEERRIVHGVQDRLKTYWNFYPSILCDSFQRSFVEGKKEYETRLSAYEWRVILNQVESQYIECKCGKKGFDWEFAGKGNNQNVCPQCGAVFYRFTNTNQYFYLTEDSEFTRNQIDEKQIDNESVIGRVVENSKQKGLFGIKNVGSFAWIGKYPDGIERKIMPGSGIPIWKGMELIFNDNNKWKIDERDD